MAEIEQLFDNIDQNNHLKHQCVKQLDVYEDSDDVHVKKYQHSEIQNQKDVNFDECLVKINKRIQKQNTIALKTTRSWRQLNNGFKVNQTQHVYSLRPPGPASYQQNIQDSNKKIPPKIFCSKSRSAHVSEYLKTVPAPYFIEYNSIESKNKQFRRFKDQTSRESRESWNQYKKNGYINFLKYHQKDQQVSQQPNQCMKEVRSKSGQRLIDILQNEKRDNRSSYIYHGCDKDLGGIPFYKYHTNKNDNLNKVQIDFGIAERFQRNVQKDVDVVEMESLLQSYKRAVSCPNNTYKK